MKSFVWKPYIAEFLGTGVLTLAVLTAISSPNIAPFTPLIAGLVLGLFVYTIGGISGSHVNPAVTIALWSIKKIKNDAAVLYIVAQLLGAIGAKLLHNAFAAAPEVTAGNTWQIGLFEAIGAFLLLFGIAAVVHKKVDDSASGLTIGGSLTLGVILAASVSNGVLNPAVALGIGSLSLAYIVGPVVGGLAAVWLYKWFAGKA